MLLTGTPYNKHAPGLNFESDYLVSRGVDRERLTARGFGPTRPVGSNSTAQGRAGNRRVAFTVVKTRARVFEAEKPPES